MKNKNNSTKKSAIYAVNLRKHRKLYRFLLFVVIIFAVFTCYMQFLVTPIMVETCNASVKVNATKCINYAIAEAMNQNLSYDDLVSIVTDSSGKISMIQANSVKINTLSKFIDRVALVQLANYSESVLHIPIGAFSGIPVFAGMGPKVSIEIFPYGDVHTTFLSEFASAGINQTLHKIYLNVNAKIKVVLPLKTVTVQNSGQVVLCESLIVGKIPEVYLQTGKLTEMLNLGAN